MFQKIVLAVDANELEEAKKLVNVAKTLGDTGAEFHVVTVVPDAGFALVGMALGPDHAQGVLQATTTQLENWANAVLGQGAHVHVLQGTVYDVVLKTAARIGADVIVVGAHRPELKDYLVGPNAARIVRHAPQSVFVAR